GLYRRGGQTDHEDGRAGTGGELAQHGEPPREQTGFACHRSKRPKEAVMTALSPIYSFSRSWEDSGGASGLRRSKNPWRAASSSAADSWSNSSAAGSSGKAPAVTGPEPDRSGGSARMISASRAITRARFSSGVSAGGSGSSP